MGLPCGIWPIFIGLIWVAEALLLGDRGDSLQLGNPQTRAVVAGNPPGGDDDDDILRINQELIPPEAPGSSFLLEGDIVKASPFRLFSSASPKWPKRRGIVRIPYVLSYKYDKQSVKIIKEAFADFAAFTCIKFVPYSYQRDFISVTPMSGCFSSVGRTGGMQVVSLAPACLRKGKGVALHELMHVVGFWHEHSRADRDKYISISWNEILTGFEINFMKSWTSNMLVNYDYSSVLHYGRYAFSMTGLPTIIPLSNPYAALGQRWNLSRSDIARVNKLYKCSQTGAEAGSPSTIKEDIMDVISNELEPCPTEGESKVSTTSRASSPGTNPLETAQSAKGPFKQTSAPTAGTEKPVGRTAMNDEELRVSLTTVQGLQSVKFAPTQLSTQGMTYLEATGKTSPTRIEMGTAEAEEKFLIPMEETSLLGTVSLQEPDFTTVMLTPGSHQSTREVTSHHGKVAEGLGTTKIPTETLAGLEFPELVSPQGLLQKTGGTRPSEVGIAETTSLQGMELAYHSTYLAQKGPSPATEFRVVALTSNQTQSMETQTELATAEITSSLEGSSGTYTPVMHTAATLALGQTPPMQVSATETSHLLSTEKWTTNLPRLTSAKFVTTMAPTRARSAPTGQTPSVEMETTTVAYATEQTSLFPTAQNWTSSPTTQRNQSYAWWATTPGSREQSTMVRPLAGKAKTEPAEAMQPTLTTSFEMAETHTASPELLFPLGATTRHKKSTSSSSSGIETSSVKPPSKAIPFMETQTELGFVEATRIKASGQHGFPSLTVGIHFPVTRVKDAEYATETETLPVTWVSQASEPAGMSMQATTANYRNKERIHSTTIGPTYTPSLGESENPVTHPQNAGPAEATRSEDHSQATLSTRGSTEMRVQEARNTSPNWRGHTCTSASVLTSPTVTELKFMERLTREASGLETAVAQASSPNEMGTAGVSSAWTEAKDQFSSSPREATLFSRSSATQKGDSTKIIQSLESASLFEVGTNKHTARYRVGAGLVTLNPPESWPRTAPMQSVEMPEWSVPGKLTPVHTEPTTNQAQRGVRNTTPFLVDKMLSLQAEPTKATYPAEGPSLLQVLSQTFSPIERRLRTSRKQQMHAAISSRDNLTPPEGTPAASLSSGELQHSAKATATQAPETPTMRAEEAEGRGNTFLFPTGTTMPAEKPYMKSAMGISESQTTSTTELQTPKASLAHAEGANFPTTTPSETANTQLLGIFETHTTHAILTWEPRSPIRPRQQTMAWFTKASPLNVSKGTSLEAPAEFRPVATTGSGMETKERGSLRKRSSPPLSQAPEVTFPPETLTANSAETGVQEAINPPRKRSRWVSHAARSIEHMSLAATEPTYATASVEPGHPTIRSSYQETAEVLGTEAGNQWSLSVSSSRMERGAQEFKGELRKEGRPSPTLPSVGRREFFEVEPSLRSQVTLLQTSRLRKGLFPFRQTHPFGGMKSAEPVTAPEESPHTTENGQLYREQTSTTVPALPSLRTPRPPPLLTPASPESNKLGSYREKQATSLQGEQVAASIPATERAPSARTATNTPPPETWETRTNSPVEMGAQVTESYKKRGREYVHTRAPVRETSPVITEQSSKTVLATNAIEDQMKMRMRTRVQGMEGRGAVPTTEGMLPVASEESTEAGYPFPETFGTQATNVTEVGGGKEAPSLPREGGGEVASTPWNLETQTISTPESATTGIPVSLRKAGARTEQTEAVNAPVTEVVHGQFLEAQTKTTPRAVVGLQGAKSRGTQGMVFAPIEGTKATYVMSSLETAEAPVTNPRTGTANITGVGASLQDTSYVLNRSIEMKAQKAASLHGKEGGHPYTTTLAGTWPVMSESEHLGRPTERTPVQETQSLHPPGRGATETASIQTKAQNLSNTIARTVPEAVHSSSVALLLETPENQTLRLGEVAMKEETSSYGEEGGLTTTHLLPSFTLSTETAEQGQSTHVHELILPENWPTGHPELGTGKHPTNKTQTGEEHTSLISMGELPSLESEPTKAVYPTEGTSLQASPRQTFSPMGQQITTTNSQETSAEIFPREEHGQSPMSPGGVQSAETEASGLLGLLTLPTSTWPPETTAQRLEEVSEFHGKRGRGKPTPLPTDTARPAKNETYMGSSTKIALGMEALEGQTTSQTVLGITEVSLAQLLGGSTHAERASFPGAEVTEAVNPVPSNGTETQTTLPNKTREVIPTASTRMVGTEATGQSYSTTMKAMGTPSSPSERMLYTATNGHRKRNGGQAYTHPLTGSMSPAGRNTTRTSSSLGLPYYLTALASTEPVRPRLESGVQSAAGEVVPTSPGFSLKTHTASSPAEGNGRESNLSTYGGVTPVGHWGLRRETYAPEWHASQLGKWALHTTPLAKSELPTSPAEIRGARTATNSAVGGMPTAGKGKAHGMKVIQLKRAFRKPPSALSAVDPEILHLVGKRSLSDAVARPAPPQDGNPALKGTALSHGQTGPELRSLLLSNPPEKQRAKALEALPKQHFPLPGFQVSPVTALSPTAKAFKGVPWWRGAGTSDCALDRKCGLFRPKEHLLLGRKKATNLAPFLMSAKAVRPTAPRGMDKPTAAPLPWDQSGPSKRGHSIRTTPKATVESGLLGWQVCDFEEDLCSWQQSDTDDFDWIRAGERPARSLPGGNVSDPRASPSGGNYISLRSPSARQTPGQKTALISPVLHGIGCIRFWYSPLGSAMGTINLYIKRAGAPEWRRIWTARGTQGTEWHPVGVAASESQKLQVMVEGVIGPEAGSDAGIDDLSVCAAACQGGCEALFAWYKK